MIGRAFNGAQHRRFAPILPHVMIGLGRMAAEVMAQVVMTPLDYPHDGSMAVGAD